MRDELVLRGEDGTVLPMDIARWHAEPSDEELDVLARVRPPAVDLGCGPGRHVVALNERGVPALGIDAAPAAVATARARGALVLERSIFARVPGVGRWGSVLLLDGNIGIGGDPISLLRRARRLVRRDGNVLVEASSPGVASKTLRVRVDRRGEQGPAFAWSVLTVDDIAATAGAAELSVSDVWEGGGRWFSELAPA